MRLLLISLVSILAIQHVSCEDPEADTKKHAAIDKVVELLGKMKSDSEEELKSQILVFKKFRLWYENTRKDKEAHKADLEEKIGVLGDDIMSTEEEIERTKKEIMSAENELENDETEKKEAIIQRAQEKKAFDAKDKDLSGAIDGCRAATDSIRDSKKAPSFAQIKSIRQTLQEASILGAALGLKQEPPMETEGLTSYTFKSDNIIKMLEKLNDEFTSERTEIRKTEATVKATHEKKVQRLTDQIRALQSKLERLNGQLADFNQSLADLESELAEKTKDLKITQTYLEDLIAMFDGKEATWLNRKTVREEEIEILNKAMVNIKEEVKPHATNKTIRLDQQETRIERVQALLQNPAAMAKIEMEAEAVDEASPLSFVQVRVHLRGSEDHPTGEVPRAIAAALQKDGSRFKSTLLTSLGNRIASGKDHFAKIKLMIESMINKLLAEDAKEQDENQKCEGDKRRSVQKRTRKAEVIESTNSKLADIEAKKLKWTNTRDESNKLAEDSQAQLDNLTEEHTAETAVNDDTIATAKAGLDAVLMVTATLKNFYNDPQRSTTVDMPEKAETHDIQEHKDTPEFDAPETGFEIGEEYGSKKGAAKGIFGMLTVIQSDFERTVADTKVSQKEADAEFLKAETDLKSVIGEQLATKEDAKARLTVLEKEQTDNKELLEEAVKSLNLAIEELIANKKECVDSGMTYDQRVEAREHEIMSLNKALCIFKNYQEYGDDAPPVASCDNAPPPSMQ